MIWLTVWFVKGELYIMGKRELVSSFCRDASGGCFSVERQFFAFKLGDFVGIAPGGWFSNWSF